MGTVEVVVFPRDYEKCQALLNDEEKVFIQGRVSAEDDRPSKLILEKIRSFEDIPRELWIQFPDRETYGEKEQELLADLKQSPGKDSVVIFLRDVKAMKKLSAAYHVEITDSWLESMCKKYGVSNVKVLQRVLKNL